MSSFLRARLRKNTILTRGCPAIERVRPLRSVHAIFFLVASCLVFSVASAAELVITSATVHVGNGEVLEAATVLVSDGRIAEVGKDGEVEIPAGAERIDASGLHLMPGMVDLRSLELVPESRGAFGVDARIAVADGLDSFEDWGRAREEGVTTVAVSGAGGSAQSSLGAVLKLRRRNGSSVALNELLLGRESHIVLSLGIAGSTSTSAQRLWEGGQHDGDLLRAEVRRVLGKEPLVGKIDYVSITDPDTFDELTCGTELAMVSVAVWLGKTRLIDNVLLAGC